MPPRLEIRPLRPLNRFLSTQPTHFFDLVFDVREIIYEEYFVPETTSHDMDLLTELNESHTSAHVCTSEDVTEPTSITLSFPKLPTALSLTNRQIHGEAQRFFKSAKSNLDVPRISVHNPYRFVHLELRYLFGIVDGAKEFCEEHITAGCTFGDVVKHVRGNWKRRGELKCKHAGCKDIDVAKDWVAQVAYRMALRGIPEVRVKLSWPASVAHERGALDEQFRWGFKPKRFLVKLE